MTNTLNRARHMKNRYTAKLHDTKQESRPWEVWMCGSLSSNTVSSGNTRNSDRSCLKSHIFTRTIAMHKFHRPTEELNLFTTNRPQVGPHTCEKRAGTWGPGFNSKSATGTLQKWWILSCERLLLLMSCGRLFFFSDFFWVKCFWKCGRTMQLCRLLPGRGSDREQYHHGSLQWRGVAHDFSTPNGDVDQCNMASCHLDCHVFNYGEPNIQPGVMRKRQEILIEIPL